MLFQGYNLQPFFNPYKSMQSFIYFLLFSFISSSNVFFHSSITSLNNYFLAENIYYSLPLKRHLFLSGNWILEEGKYKNEKIISSSENPIKISFYENHITGFAVINDYFATFEQKPAKEEIINSKDKIPLKISKEIFISKEVSDIKLMNLSSNYLRALQNIDHYYVKNKTLFLTGKDIELKFKASR